MQYVQLILTVLKIIKYVKSNEGIPLDGSPAGQVIVTKLADAIGLDLSGIDLDTVLEIAKEIHALRK